MEIMYRKLTKEEKQKIEKNILEFLSNDAYLKEQKFDPSAIEFRYRTRRNAGLEASFHADKNESILLDSIILEGMRKAVKSASPRFVAKPLSV